MWAIIKSVLILFLRYDVGHFPDLGIVFSVLVPIFSKKIIKCVGYFFRIINQFTIGYNLGCTYQVGLFCINYAPDSLPCFFSCHVYSVQSNFDSILSLIIL